MHILISRLALLLSVIVSVTYVGVNVSNILLRHEKHIEQKPQILLPQAVLPTTEPENLECSSVNQDNPFLEAATTYDENDNEIYNIEWAIDEFLMVQDENFAERIEEFTSTSQGFGCDLSEPEVESATADHGITPPDEFAAERIPELRQLDCAFEKILRSGKPLCGAKIQQLGDAYTCDEQYRKWKLESKRKMIRMAMQSAIIQMDEMAIAWPLHKRLECVNEKLADQRVNLLKFIKPYAKLPAAFINAAQSK
jgi:hypothetical protein